MLPQEQKDDSRTADQSDSQHRNLGRHWILFEQQLESSAQHLVFGSYLLALQVPIQITPQIQRRLIPVARAR